MGKLTVYDASLSRETILKERGMRYQRLPVLQKLQALFNLIHLSVKLNDGKPLKTPQGKGVIIKKQNS